MKMDKFCPIARLVYFFLDETKEALLDYYHIFESEKSLTELFETMKTNTSKIERATLSLRPCYKTPQTLTRMVSISLNVMIINCTNMSLTCVNNSLS